MSQEDIVSLISKENLAIIVENSEGSDKQLMEYEEQIWPADDDPTGFSFKGKKKIFIKAVESLKLLMTKGNQKDLGKVSFKVLDSRKSAHGTEIDIEIQKDNKRGIAVLKIFGPNKRKDCTLTINKSRKYDYPF